MLEFAPEILDIMVLFKLTGALDVFDTVLVHPAADLGDDHRIDTLVLIFIGDGYQQGIDRVVVTQRPENMDETEREHMPFGFLQSL